ncbi:diguanylate cyclase [Dokdonella sp.]|uniref:ligand-binding sensor domain-containing diguanylate cyclase n=1 Tax=Dokdonella sp. TaxID=2291710 RepID=UPI002F42EEB3
MLGRDAGLPDLDLLGATLIESAVGSPVLWLGTISAGIVRLDVADPRHPRVLADDLPPPPDSTAYSALSDHDGRVYICTNNGVQLLVPQSNRYASRVFTRSDGMVHDECNRGAQFIDAHDRYWAGTLGGLTVYDPKRAVQDTQPKALELIGLRVDDRAVEGTSLRVAPTAHEIAIDYSLLSWQREGESRYRSQLVGYEESPGEWTAQSSRTFNALPPGRYRLRIEGRDYAGNVSAPLDVAIEVEARWWQEAWARVAGAAALVLLGYAAVLWRVRALKAQRRELELRVASRTVELNEANARLLELSYVDALTGLANRRRLLETLERDPVRARPCALILVDVDHFKAYNDRHGHPAGDEALRAVARTLRDGMPADALVARYGGEEFACLLEGADATTAVALAERIRAAVAARDIAVPGTKQVRRVTISAGVASAILAAAADAHALLRNADIALYQAKREGRDRVRSADDRVP